MAAEKWKEAYKQLEEAHGFLGVALGMMEELADDSSCRFAEIEHDQSGKVVSIQCGRKDKEDQAEHFFNMGNDGVVGVASLLTEPAGNGD